MRVLILEDDHWTANLLKQIVLNLRPHADIVCLGSAVMLMRLAACGQDPLADSQGQARLRRLAGLA
ncbi:hypothetical protein [Pseudomonas sp.]|uniref:hypothetical protein n=1 Tax=Pseudomonas sp. TaxID=306 RepID=UPI0035699CB6